MATKKTVEHSKHFAKVKKYYDKDLWSKARVYKAVECKWITADEYKEITGEEYTGGLSVNDLVYTVAVTAIVSGLVGSVVSALVAALKSQGRKAVERTEAEKATDDALRMGVRALLWRELKNIHEQAVRQGGLTVADRKHLENVYAAYHGLGGNGTGTRLYEDAMKMPVID